MKDTSPSIKSRFQQYRWEMVFFLLLFIFIAVFWSSAIVYNEKGELVAGHANLWGDWAVHFTMGSAMAYKELLLSNSPLMADAAFSYPFATNLISAGLIRLGVPFHLAFVIPSFLFSLFFVVAVYSFCRTFLRQRHIALLAAALFLFNGGIGIYYYLIDVINSAQPLTTLINPPHEYTNYEPQHIKWISVFSSMVFPQRAFALGFGTCLIALSLIFHSFQLLTTRTRAPLWLSTILASVCLGLLPLLHTHSFLAAFIILSFWFIADLVRTNKLQLKTRLLHWITIIIITSSIALPIVFTYFWGHVGGHFFKWFPGWYAKEFDINWFVLWFKNWTFVPFLGFIGFTMLVVQQKNKRARWHTLLILLPGILLFLVPNLFLTQPWLWDNTKLFIWSSVSLSPMAAYASYRLLGKNGLVYRSLHTIGLRGWHAISGQRTFELQTTPQTGNNPDLVKLTYHLPAIAKQRIHSHSERVRKILFATLVMLMCSSGALDAYYTARTDLHKFTMYNKNELALAEWVKANTDIDSIWLTSTKHNHWLFNLTGRQALLTYIGWLWTHGYDYYQYEQDAKAIFQTGSEKLIKQHGINYIVYGHSARHDMKASKRVLDERFKVVKQLGQYTIYETGI